MMKTKTLTLLCGVTLLFACNKENDEPTIFGCTDSSAENYNSSATENDGSCTYQDTTTFKVDLNLRNSNDFNFDNPNLIVKLQETGNGDQNEVAEQTLSAADFGVEEQNYFSIRMKVDKPYIISVVDPNDIVNWGVYEGDTTYYYNTVISTTIGISIEEWGYKSHGYKEETAESVQIQYAGQADFEGNFTAGHFRVILNI